MGVPNNIKFRHITLQLIRKFTATLIISFTAIPAISCSNQDPDKQSPKNPMSEYTAENPGEWAPLKDEHIPRINIFNDTYSHEVLRVTVSLKKPSPAHYIEVIGVMDENKKTLWSKPFSKDTKVFSVTIPVESGWDLRSIKVYAKCNLHDTWTAGNLADLQ